MLEVEKTLLALGLVILGKGLSFPFLSLKLLKRCLNLVFGFGAGNNWFGVVLGSSELGTAVNKYFCLISIFCFLVGNDSCQVHLQLVGRMVWIQK